MTSFKLAKWLLVGGAAAYAYSRRRSASRQRTPDAEAPTGASARRVPAGPVTEPIAFADLEPEDLEIADDLSRLDSDLDESALGIDTPAEMTADAYITAETGRDAGELYGLHTPRAQDTALPDDDRAFQEGQNWIEALESSAAENGILPEAEISLLDEQDERHVATEPEDRPIADLGSAGPRGM